MARKKNVLGAAIAAILAGGPAFAADVQRIEITGSAARRIDAETALPVQVVSKEDIQRTGVTSVEALLQTISATSSSGGIANATGAGSSTYGRSTISLRGLGGSRTLVMVNGRRVAPAAGGGGTVVDVNTIPLAAIERVEVLKDGASSLYGSDAIAGVVNFILSKDLQGVTLEATAGTPTASGGGASQRASLAAGFGDRAKDRFHVTVGGVVEREKALFAKDRSYASTGNQFPYLVAGATGQGNIEGGYVPGSGQPVPAGTESGSRVAGFGGSPGTGYGNPLAAANQCESISMFRSPTDTTKGAPYCAFDSNAFVGLVPKRELTALTSNAVFDLTPTQQLFGDLLLSRSVVTQTFQPSPLRRSFMFPSDSAFQAQGVDPVLLVRPNNPNYQIAADYLNANGFGSIVGTPLAVTGRVFDFGLRSNEDTHTNTRIVLGARGDVFGGDYEVAYSRSTSRVQGKVPSGYFSQAAFAKVVNRDDSDYNPWSLTQSSTFVSRLAAANAQYTGATQDARSTVDGVDAVLRGDAFKFAGAAAQYAAGVQVHKDRYRTSPSEALQSGDIAGLGGATPPIDQSRTVKSVFGELAIPLVKTLDATVGARHDRYSDVGSASTYKSTLRWAPMREVVLRGAIGTGFRAPSLEDLYLAQTVGTSEQFNDPTTGEKDLQVPSLTGGNPSLKPERSRQRSIGIVLAPIEGLTASLDWFHIKMTDVITVPSAQLIVSRFRAGDPAYAGLVTLDAENHVAGITAVQSNTGSLTVSGVDLGANYRTSLGGMRLDVGFNGTYMDRFEEMTPSGALSHKVGTIVDAEGNPVVGAETGGVVLRWKHVLGATLSAGAWSGTLTQNFYKGYETGRRQIDGERNFVRDTATYDLHVAYSGFKNTRLSVGVKNLFDKQPPMFVPVSNQFQAGYDITQYDPRGRFVYVTGSVSF